MFFKIQSEVIYRYSGKYTKNLFLDLCIAEVGTRSFF
jgi:hypothetical protein